MIDKIIGDQDKKKSTILVAINETKSMIITAIEVGGTDFLI